MLRGAMPPACSAAAKGAHLEIVDLRPTLNAAAFAKPRERCQIMAVSRHGVAAHAALDVKVRQETLNMIALAGFHPTPVNESARKSRARRCAARNSVLMPG